MSSAKDGEKLRKRSQRGKGTPGSVRSAKCPL